jgi:hypothetical protein
MALDWSIGLHAICVRVDLDIKTAAPKKGYLLEFTAFMFEALRQQLPLKCPFFIKLFVDTKKID